MTEFMVQREKKDETESYSHVSLTFSADFDIIMAVLIVFLVCRFCVDVASFGIA